MDSKTAFTNPAPVPPSQPSAATDEAQHQRLQHDKRREELLLSVLEECAEKGVSRFSVSNVTKRVGVTRSLFYHYFPTKEDAIAAAMELSIDDFITQLEDWNARRAPGDIEGALTSVCELIRNMVLNEGELPKLLINEGHASLYTGFLHKVADRCARYVCDSTVAEFATLHTVEIDHVYETFYVLIVGLAMYIRTHPDASVELIRDIAASTLHLNAYLAPKVGLEQKADLEPKTGA